MKLRVFAKPNARQSGIRGRVAASDPRGEGLEVALAAPPVDGKANAELIATLARALGVAKRQITVTAGEGSRAKWLEIEGLTREELDARIDAALSRR